MPKIYFTTVTIEKNGARFLSVELSRETANAVYTWNILADNTELERVNFQIAELSKTRGVKQLRDVIAKVKPLAQELLALEFDSMPFRAKWWEIKNTVEGE